MPRGDRRARRPAASRRSRQLQGGLQRGFLQSLQNRKHGHPCILKVKGRNLERVLRKEYADLLPGLTLIKIDAEGYDKEIIKSLAGIIAEFRPTIIAECNSNLTPEERADLFNALNGLGYSVQRLEGFTISAKPSDIGSPGEMTKWRHFDVVAVPCK